MQLLELRTAGSAGPQMRFNTLARGAIEIAVEIGRKFI
jgi:hypothetical protein